MFILTGCSIAPLTRPSDSPRNFNQEFELQQKEFELRNQELKNNADAQTNLQNLKELKKNQNLYLNNTLPKKKNNPTLMSADPKHLSIHLSKRQKIRSIEVRSGLFVDGIEFTIYNPSNGSVVKSGMCGGQGGTSHQIVFDEDEYLIGLFGGRGDVLDSIGFVTNKKKYGPYGGKGGTSFESTLQNRKGVKVINVLAKDYRNSVIVDKISIS